MHNGDKDSNREKKSLVNIENKKKLLATLRAIDNGDSIESLEEPKQDNIIKEIFGKVAHWRETLNVYKKRFIFYLYCVYIYVRCLYG